ncbi:hypothetical protein YWIDRAFT_06341 [Streptomyces sp. SceaMP-e96]|nr:hypothetical protein YWIDRAFT_06341 [Streptomyces sp. SceaMP-e96]
MVDALADGYERAQHLAVCQEEAARREFIDDLLHGEPIWGVSPNLERFGLCFSHTHTDAHAVAVAEGTAAYSEADPLARHVELALLGRFGTARRCSPPRTDA